MRTPSSSSSKMVTGEPKKTVFAEELQRTDVNRLDPDAFLHVRCLGAVGNLVG